MADANTAAELDVVVRGKMNGFVRDMGRLSRNLRARTLEAKKFGDKYDEQERVIARANANMISSSERLRIAKLNEARAQRQVTSAQEAYKKAARDNLGIARSNHKAVRDLRNANLGLARAQESVRKSALSNDEVIRNSTKVIETVNYQRSAWGRLNGAVHKFAETGKKLRGFRMRTMAMFGAVSVLGTAVAALAQGASVLVGGLTALTAGILPAIGGIVSLTGGLGASVGALAAVSAAMAPAALGVGGLGYAALGAAAGLGVFRLATVGVMDAVGGLNDALDPKKLEKLTPAARALARQLHFMKAPLRDLQGTAQGAMFPGMVKGLRSIKGAMGALRPTVDKIAQAIGGAAAEMGAFIAEIMKGDEIKRLGSFAASMIRQAVGPIKTLARAGINLLDSMRPLAEWMFAMARHIANWAAESINAAIASGRMAKLIEATKFALLTMGKVLYNTGGLLIAIGKAAYPVGKRLATAFANATKGAKDWANSMEGQTRLTKFFEASERSMRRVAAISKNLGSFLASMFRAANPGAESMAQSLVDVTKRLADWGKSSAGMERMTRFFEASRKSLKAIGGILGPLTSGLTGVFSAAFQPGLDMLGLIGKNAEAFDKWANSAKGQNRLKKYFENTRPAMIQFGKLIKDVGGAFLRLGEQPGTAKMIESIRKLIPHIEKSLNKLGDSGYFDTLIETVGSLIDLFTQVAIAAEPIVKIVGDIAQWIAKMAENHKSVSWLMTGLFGIGTGLAVIGAAVKVFGPGIKGLMWIFGKGGKDVSRANRALGFFGKFRIPAWMGAMTGKLRGLAKGFGALALALAAWEGGKAISRNTSLNDPSGNPYLLPGVSLPNGIMPQDGEMFPEVDLSNPFRQGKTKNSQTNTGRNTGGGRPAGPSGRPVVQHFHINDAGDRLNTQTLAALTAREMRKAQTAY